MAVDPTNLVASQLAGFTNAPQLAPGQIFPTGLNFGGGLNPLGNPLAGGFAVPGPLAGTPEGGSVDAHGIQAYYTGLVAREIGLGVELSSAPECVTLRAIGEAKAASGETPETTSDAA